eukprot:1112449-Pyramimonas_sp.AAC.1
MVEKGAQQADATIAETPLAAAIHGAGNAGPTRAGGCAQVEATYDDMVPLDSMVPNGFGHATIDPWRAYIDAKRFPAVSDGSEGGARRSLRN